MDPKGIAASPKILEIYDEFEDLLKKYMDEVKPSEKVLGHLKEARDYKDMKSGFREDFFAFNVLNGLGLYKKQLTDAGISPEIGKIFGEKEEETEYPPETEEIFKE